MTLSVALLQAKSPPEEVARTQGGPDPGARDQRRFGWFFQFDTKCASRTARLLCAF